MTREPRFVIEDELHAEWIAECSTMAEVVGVLERLAAAPWDAPPNRAPCTSWETCGREYVVLEFDAADEARPARRRLPALEVTAAGATWDPEFDKVR